MPCASGRIATALWHIAMPVGLAVRRSTAQAARAIAGSEGEDLVLTDPVAPLLAEPVGHDDVTAPLAIVADGDRPPGAGVQSAAEHRLTANLVVDSYVERCPAGIANLETHLFLGCGRSCKSN